MTDEPVDPRWTILPDDIHNPTAGTRWPMSDRDWLTLAYVIHEGRDRWSLHRLTPPDFEDPNLPHGDDNAQEFDDAFVEFFMAMLPVHDRWKRHVGVQNAAFWREANEHMKSLEAGRSSTA